MLGFTVAPADADPLDEAREQVETLEMEAAALDQDYAAAQQRLEDAEERLAAKQGELEEQQDKVEGMRGQISRIALAQYQGRHLDPTTRLLMSPDSDGFMSQFATVEKVNDTQNAALQTFQTEQANLADLQRSTEAEVSEIAGSEASMAQARQASEERLAEAQAVLERLTEEERQRIAEQERREAEAAAQAAEAAEEEAAEAAEEEAAEAAEAADTEAADTEQTDAAAPDEPATRQQESDDSDDSAADSSSPTTVSSGSGRAADAVAFAKAQIGKPYGYGSTGPGAYDCSGLTGAAWRNAGVSLPRTSQAQFGAGQAVSVSDLQPGDLVFYYGGISHVGMYVGGGQIVHASRPGKPIGYAPLNSMPVAGARRVG
ncbi:Cell wall-associated hydrolase, NlpC family [Auraticoccus monumenti]|uniref:Cell wall-associated hydrolase, NlpC family n=1 Tax=Auraticoccus monumenti TaxID=675864 RepID=A0A1G7DU07_9ACTN|nr:Cell wall-associated hydrolase, NlpC family [Auraticoccus monumenti]